MLKVIFFLCFIVFASCSYHSYTKEEAVKNAKKVGVKGRGKMIIEDNDRILKVFTRDSSYEKLDEIYQFDNDGNQIRYTLNASCDLCFQKYLSKKMKEDLGWKKLNDSTYISSYYFKQFLCIHKSTFSYEVVKHNLSRVERRNLITNAGRKNDKIKVTQE